MRRTYMRDKKGRPRLWILPMLIVISMSFVSAYGACSDCEKPNPDYDPTNPYETDPECVLDPDKASKPGSEFDNGGSGKAVANIHKQYITYNVHGSTLGQVLFSSTQNGPLDDHGGETLAEFSWDFNMSSTSEGLPCPCEDGSDAFEATADIDVTVNLSLTITLPYWVEYDQGTCRAKQEWDNFSSALSEHEEKHVKIFEDAANELASSLSGLHVTLVACGGDDTSAKNAALDALKAKMDDIIDQAIKKAISDNAALDAPGSADIVPPLNTSEEGDCP